jgi:WD40 repeat protein
VTLNSNGWRPDRGTPPPVNPIPPDEFMSRVFALAFSPDGKILATRDYKRIYLWDAVSGRNIGCYESHGVNEYIMVGALAFSPDGKILASSRNTEGQPVDLWDVQATSDEKTLPIVQPLVSWPNDLLQSSRRGIETHETSRKRE